MTFKYILQACGAVMFTLVATLASAQLPSYGPSIALDAAKKVAAAANAEAKKNNWNMAIAIVDAGGSLVYYERMDDTQNGSVQVAIEKAKTSANFKRPSRVFEEGVAKGRVALLGLAGAMPITGGVPIMSGGKVIGAIGVSGATGDQDEQCAKAGADTVK